jgi:hypothetical protein
MFIAKGTTEGTFICKFNPPLPTEGGGGVGWVVIKKHWWCGRFKPNDNLTAIEWVAWQKGLTEDAKA